MKPFSPSLLLFCSALILLTLLSCTQEFDPTAGEPEVVTEGFQFTEGPYWHSDGYLLFSDIPANRIYKWTPGNPESEVFLEPSGNSNGIDARPDGTLLLAQHAGMVSEVTDSLTTTPIASEYNGMRLNSPNDLTVRSDGLIYFTDPTFGVSDEEQELDFAGVYRINSDGSVELLYDRFRLPNGIAFSPDESYLYINDSDTGQILRFEVLDNGNIENPEPFANVGALAEMGGSDGMVTDTDGRLYTTGPNGLIIYDRDRNVIKRIPFDHQITNLAWGGDELRELYVTSPSAIYRIPMNTQGW
ncbi:SMP-30/gluconolactonase/LRE family protein [Rhodohalobacter mucosus]|uniref:Gluconolactonase n=1 Tax=Rhodohalobacter mucosus TaxID=2079485 RepID=A0A316TVZ0_9BACT|nr:SMP-30/gluconolactonase/LRE family protein [Rhodohalobacter mucosus]PWN08011.1 gluconolactonase [Rhodohalobacter mucosus]